MGAGKPQPSGTPTLYGVGAVTVPGHSWTPSVGIHNRRAVACTTSEHRHSQSPGVGIHNLRASACTIAEGGHPQSPGRRMHNRRASIAGPGCVPPGVGGPQTARPPPPPRWGTGARLAPNLRPTACRFASLPVVSCHLDAGAEGTRIASNHAAFRGVESEADERTRTADPFTTSEVLDRAESP